MCMKVQAIQNMNCAFKQAEETGKKKKNLYRGATCALFTAGAFALGSDRLLKSPKNLNKFGKFGFWATWGAIALFAIGIGKSIYDLAIKSYRDTQD